MIFLQYLGLRPSDSSDMESRKEEVCLRKRAGSRASRTLNLTSGKCFRFRLSKRFSHLYQQHQIFVPGRPTPIHTFIPTTSALQQAFSSEPSNTPPGRLNSKVTRRITSRQRFCCTSPGESILQITEENEDVFQADR